ncbi:MAG: hypothetical protein ACOZBL_01660 [Patescibacteria group bacterium]
MISNHKFFANYKKMFKRNDSDYLTQEEIFSNNMLLRLFEEFVYDLAII